LIVRTAILVAIVMVLGASAEAENLGRIEGFFRRYCHDCHSGTHAEAGLELTALPADLSDAAMRQRFVRVYDRVIAGEMPPEGSERPSMADRNKALRALDKAIIAAETGAAAVAGRIRMRRMTRSELENTLRDLLALPRLEIREMLPPDARVAGFEKVADTLDLSLAHVQAYAAAAEKALTAAIATRSTPPPVFKARLKPAGLFKLKSQVIEGNSVLLRDGQPDPAMPLLQAFPDRRGVVHQIVEREPVLWQAREKLYEQMKFAAGDDSIGMLMENIAGRESALDISVLYPGLYRMRLATWGFSWDKGEVRPTATMQAAALRRHAEGRQQEDGQTLAVFDAPSLEPTAHEVAAWLDANDTLVFDPVSVRNTAHVWQMGGQTAGHEGDGVALDWFEIEGPIHESWPPESHRRLFGTLPIQRFNPRSGAVPPVREPLRPAGGVYRPRLQELPPAERNPPLEAVFSKNPHADARRLLAEFLPRAFRRPVEANEVEPYAALVEERLAANDCFEDAMRRAYVAALTSPEFLFHTAAAQQGDSHLFALASRLSYWLWNSPPDEPLLAAAADGTLAKRAVLIAQVDRLLADEKSARFIEDFTNQWLELEKIDETIPDKQLYPEYSWLLREGMLAETRGFFRECIAKNEPVKVLADSDFSILTQRLAEHYGIEGVEGVEARRVSLPAMSHRGGLLTQAAILKLTANGTVTSPVTRGKWVMDRFFNVPSPPPPPGISAIDPDTRGATTIREQLDRHRSDASCAACHAKIDPPGFALEGFDPVGGYRTRYRIAGSGDPPPPLRLVTQPLRFMLGPNVDASGRLPNGKSFNGIDAFRNEIARKPRIIAQGFTSHLVRYATGADISFTDRKAIETIVASTKTADYGVRSLIRAVATSDLFIGLPP
jgi:hypothetical protein